MSKHLFIISYNFTGNHYHNGYIMSIADQLFSFLLESRTMRTFFVVADRINLKMIFLAAKDMIIQLVCIDIITYVCHIITRSGSLILGVDLKTIWTVSVGDHCIFMHLFSFLLSNITFKYTLQSKGY